MINAWLNAASPYDTARHMPTFPDSLLIRLSLSACFYGTNAHDLPASDRLRCDTFEVDSLPQNEHGKGGLSICDERPGKHDFADGVPMPIEALRDIACRLFASDLFLKNEHRNAHNSILPCELGQVALPQWI